VLAEKLNLRAEDILREYRKLGFSDLGSFVTWGPDGVAMLPS
jgi:hypothetical protein